MRLALHAGRGAWRPLHLLAMTLLALLGAGLLGAGLLAWRLSEGPIALPFLAARLEAAAARRGISLRLGELAVAWNGFRDGTGQPLVLRVTDARADAADGRPIARLGTAELTLSVPGLLHGRLRPRTLLLRDAVLNLLREPDGGVHLPGLRPAPDATPPPDDRPDLVRLLRGLSRPVAEASPQDGPLGELRAATLREVAVRVLDRQLGTPWGAEALTATLRRRADGGVVGTAGATLVLGALAAPDAAPLPVSPGSALAPSPPAPDPSVRGTAPAAAPTVRAALTLAAALRPEGTTLEATLAPVSPAGLAAAAPGLAPLGALDAPVGLHATALLDAALHPVSAGLDATVGPGALRLARGVVALRGGALALDATAALAEPAPVGGSAVPDGRPPLGLLRLHDARLDLAAPPGARVPAPSLRLEGELRPAPRGFALAARLFLDQLGFADLRHYWPTGLATDARAWVTGNVTAGIARDGRLAASVLLAPDLSGATLTGLTARVAGEDLTAAWLRPVPPVEHASAVLTLANPDALEVAVTGGRDAGLRLAGATIRVTGLQARDQAATISADLAGSVHDAVALLSHPRLHLLSRHPLPFRDPSGSVGGHLGVALPLRADLDADQINLRYALRLSALHLGDVALGRSLDAGELALDGTAEGLEAHGTARLGGLPGTVTLATNFRDGPPSQVLTRAALAVSADAAALAAAGLDTAEVVRGGPVALTARYAERRDGGAGIALDADLSAAAIEAPTGWRKPPGVAATGGGRLLLDHGRLLGGEDLRLDAPGLRLRARLEARDGRPATLRVEDLVLGRTRVSGEVLLPRTAGVPVRARLSGPLLDLSARLDPRPAAPATAPPPAGPPATPVSPGGLPWALDARLERVLLGDGRSLAPVATTAEGRGAVLRGITLHAGVPPSAVTPGAPPAAASRDASTTAGAPGAVLSATLAPAPPPATAGTRHLVLEAADAGALLAGLDVVHDVRGGRLALDAVLAPVPPGAARRIAGTATLTDFAVTDAPAVGRLLQAATLYGLADLAMGPGLNLRRLVLPFRLDGDLLRVTDARAYSASLGVTAHGTLDLARRTARLEGTVVPAWFLNQLPSRIPLLGRLFSAEPGGGLFAATFTLHGPLDDPAVSVNPLATLAPGVLRNLLGHGE